MKAIVYTNYGAAEVLDLQEREKPIAKANEVLIRVRAAEATKSDCELRSFNFPVKWFWLPLRLFIGLRKPKRQILGGYFSGEIEAVGDTVTAFRKGDKVFGSAGVRMGAYGEYICLAQGQTIEFKPDKLSFEEASAVPLGGLNALHFIRLASIEAGEKVLINGAGGSIGTFAVQLAKSIGAEVTVVDSAIKEDMLRKLGADHFIDYQKQDFTQTEKRYDVILSMVAQTPYAEVLKTLEPKGRYLLANPRLADMLRANVSSRFSNKKVIFAFARETKEELQTLASMIEAEQLKPVIDKIYPMTQAAQAHHRVETEQRLGSVVIAID